MASSLSPWARSYGIKFTFSTVRSVTGDTEPVLVERFRELLDTALIVEEGDGQFIFRHALVRRALQSRAPAPERRLTHCRVAEALKALWAKGDASVLYDTRPITATGPKSGMTPGRSPRLQQHALELGAPQAALTHITNAIHATDRQGQPRSAEHVRLRAQAWEALGRFDSALEDFESVLAIVESAGTPDSVVETLLAIGMLWSSRDYARAEAFYNRALKEARAARDDLLIAHRLNHLGNWQANTEQPHIALERHAEALEIFTAASLELEKTQTLDLLGMTSYLAGDFDAALVNWQHALQGFETTGNRRLIAACRANIVNAGPILDGEAVKPAMPVEQTVALALRSQCGKPMTRARRRTRP